MKHRQQRVVLKRGSPIERYLYRHDIATEDEERNMEVLQNYSEEQEQQLDCSLYKQLKSIISDTFRQLLSMYYFEDEFQRKCESIVTGHLLEYSTIGEFPQEGNHSNDQTTLNERNWSVSTMHHEAKKRSIQLGKMHIKTTLWNRLFILCLSLLTSTIYLDTWKHQVIMIHLFVLIPWISWLGLNELAAESNREREEILQQIAEIHMRNTFEFKRFRQLMIEFRRLSHVVLNMVSEIELLSRGYRLMNRRLSAKSIISSGCEYSLEYNLSNITRIELRNSECGRQFMSLSIRDALLEICETINHAIRDVDLEQIHAPISENGEKSEFLSETKCSQWEKSIKNIKLQLMTIQNKRRTLLHSIRIIGTRGTWSHKKGMFFKLSSLQNEPGKNTIAQLNTIIGDCNKFLQRIVDDNTFLLNQSSTFEEQAVATSIAEVVDVFIREINASFRLVSQFQEEIRSYSSKKGDQEMKPKLEQLQQYFDHIINRTEQFRNCFTSDTRRLMQMLDPSFKKESSQSLSRILDEIRIEKHRDQRNFENIQEAKRSLNTDFSYSPTDSQPDERENNHLTNGMRDIVDIYVNHSDSSEDEDEDEECEHIPTMTSKGSFGLPAIPKSGRAAQLLQQRLQGNVSSFKHAPESNDSFHNLMHTRNHAKRNTRANHERLIDELSDVMRERMRTRTINLIKIENCM